MHEDPRLVDWPRSAHAARRRARVHGEQPSFRLELSVLLIYGSTGYTGRLIVAEALARGLRPTLAGRNAEP